MLEVGKERLGDQVKLIEADVVTMNLGTQFDAAISNGFSTVSKYRSKKD